MEAKKLARLGIICSLALIAFLVESFVPPLFPPAPYVKIGLSNVFIILLLVLYGEREALLVLLAKNILGGVISGVWVAFAVNMAGSFSSLFVMILLLRYVFPKAGIVSVSIAGAVVSNVMRSVVTALMVDTPGILLQIPAVLGISIAAGVIIGASVYLIIRYVPEKTLR